MSDVPQTLTLTSTVPISRLLGVGSLLEYDGLKYEIVAVSEAGASAVLVTEECD